MSSVANVNKKDRIDHTERRAGINILKVVPVVDTDRNRDRDNDNKSTNGVKKIDESEPYTLYFDGGSRGNGTSHAVAGCGYIIYDPKGKEFTKGSVSLGMATNNEAEYNGLLMGIMAAKQKKLKRLVVKGDSQLVIRQMTGEYKVKKQELRLVYDQITRLCNDFDNVSFLHVERALNGAADKLANEAIDSYIKRHKK